MNFLTQDELLKILEIAKEISLRDYLMILLAYRHGLRATEVCSLRTTDIVNGALDIKRLKGSIRTVQPLESHRGVPLLNEVGSLAAWMKSERPTDSGDALFPSAKGGCLTGHRFNRLFHKYAEKAGLPEEKSHPHVLKHSLANHLIRAGVDLAYVKTRLGHASISSTMRYVNLNDEEVAAKTKNALLSIF